MRVDLHELGRIPIRLLMLGLHVPLLLTAATLTWLKNRPMLMPVGF